MRNDPIYRKFRQLAVDGAYTADDVRTLTRKQVAGLLGNDGLTVSDTDEFWSGANEGYFTGLKLNVAQELQRAADVKIAKAVKAAIVQLYPKADIELERGHDGLRVTLWPEGKPQVDLEVGN